MSSPKMTPAALYLRNPFPGLRPFRDDEADRFFGQEDSVEDVIYRLSHQRFLTLLGLSGCGKSSLINAGVLAQLRPALVATGQSRWRIARLSPSNDPLGSLAQALDLCFPTLAPVRTELERDTRAVTRLIERAELDPRQKVLLVVDQFEELFRYQEGGQPSRKEHASQFVQLLLEAINSEQCPVHVLLAMRSEYLGDCATFHRLAEEVNKATYLIPKMDRECVADIIVQPVELRNASIDPSLVQHLINESEALEDGLPLLQHALRRLWDEWVKRGASDSPIGWDDLGEPSLEVLLNRHLDSIYEDLSRRQKRTAERLFRELADHDARGRVTRLRKDLSSITLPEVEAVVAAFRNEEQGRTFLVRSGATLDVSHECLLRRWDKARTWLEKEDRDHEHLLTLAGAARDAGWPHPTAPLAGLTLDTLGKWDADSSPNAEWARRYGVDFAAAKGFLDWSATQARKKARRRKWLIVGAIGGALVLAIVMSVLWLGAREATSLANSRALAARAETLTFLGNGGEALDAATKAYYIAPTSEAVEAVAHAIPQQLAKLEGHAGPVVSAAFSPDGQRVVTASWDDTARVWNTATGQVIAKLEGHAGPVVSAAFSPDGQRVVTASSDHTARVWNAATGQVIAKLEGHAGLVLSAVFSPDGQRVVTASDDHSARVWNAATGQVIAKLEGHADRVFNAGFSLDGQRVVTASSDHTARVWNAATSQVIAKLEGHASFVFSAVFSPDGQRVVTASDDHTARVWNAVTGQVIGKLEGHAGPVFSAVFSPDGQRLLTASDDNTARVWNASTGQVIAKLEGNARSVLSAGFSPDGQRVVTASWDGTTWVWKIVTLDDIDRLLARKK